MTEISLDLDEISARFVPNVSEIAATQTRSRQYLGEICNVSKVAAR